MHWCCQLCWWIQHKADRYNDEHELGIGFNNRMGKPGRFRRRTLGSSPPTSLEWSLLQLTIGTLASAAITGTLLLKVHRSSEQPLNTTIEAVQGSLMRGSLKIAHRSLRGLKVSLLYLVKVFPIKILELRWTDPVPPNEYMDGCLPCLLVSLFFACFRMGVAWDDEAILGLASSST